jgi:hypothetical protein
LEGGVMEGTPASDAGGKGNNEIIESGLDF